MGQMGPAVMRAIEWQFASFPSCFCSFSYRPAPAKGSVDHLEPVLKTPLQLGTQLFLHCAAPSLELRSWNRAIGQGRNCDLWASPPP